MSLTRILNYIADSITRPLVVSSIASVAILFREGGEGRVMALDDMVIHVLRILNMIVLDN